MTRSIQLNVNKVARKCFFVILLLVFVGKANAQADFTFSTSTGTFCAGQTVIFAATPVTDAQAYIWNFGNGQVGSGVNPSTTYTAGTYTVSLTVVRPTGASTTTKDIVINPQPTVTLNLDKTAICRPESIVLTANPSGAPIQTYNWNFGDGNTGITATNSTSHTYTSYQSYTASVEVVTAFGCKSSATASLNLQRIGITGTISPDRGCIPMPVTLSYSASLMAGDAVQSSVWDFGDASPTVTNAGTSIGHTYNITSPINNANVLVTTSQGCSNNFVFPAAGFGTPPFNLTAGTTSGQTNFCGSETVSFTANATNANSYFWEYGDGASGFGNATASHKYSTLGPQVVKVTSYFNGCKGEETTFTINIVGVIVGFSETNTCSAKNIVQFTNTSLGNITSFEWLFSDQPGAPNTTNLNPIHTFPVTGDFTVRFVVRDATTGCNDTLIKPFYFRNPAANKDISKQCKDSLVTYWVTNAYPAAAGFNYEYHVNNQIAGGVNQDTLRFYPSNYGTFTEYVVIRNSNSGLCNDTLSLGQTTVSGPIPNFTFNNSVCQNQFIIFNNTSSSFIPSETISTYIWNYGHGAPDTVITPAPHIFPSSGDWNVSLTAIDINGCRQRITKPVSVLPITGVFAFPIIDTICEGQSIDLQAYSVDPISWTPATNIICTNCDSTTVWPTTTTSYVAHTFNSTSGCENTDTVKIVVYNRINLNIEPIDTIVCPKSPVPFRSNYNDLIFAWSPPTYLSAINIGNPVSIPDTTISYQIIGSDSIGCFSDTVAITVNTFQPAVVNGGRDTLVSYMQQFALIPSYTPAIVSYVWSPALPLHCSNCPFPTGNVPQTTLFTVTGTSADGCKDTATVRVIVNCEGNLLLPKAFTPNNDGLNDIFYPITFGINHINHFAIYNRFGQMVFERNNFAPNVRSMGWDGRVSGENKENTQAFVYIIEAVCDKGTTINQKGTVLLIR